MKIKDVLAVLCGLDPELDCTIETLPTHPDFNRRKGAFGIPFKVEPIEGIAGAAVRVSLTEIRMPAGFKTDKASVDEALAYLLPKLRLSQDDDIEAINDATWHAAAQFDVDQTALEDALAAAF